MRIAMSRSAHLHKHKPPARKSLFPPFPSSAFRSRCFHVVLFFFVATLPARLPDTRRSSTRGSLVCFVTRFLASPRPDPFLSRLLPEPPSSSLPVLHLPARTAPPDAPPLALQGPAGAVRRPTPGPRAGRVSPHAWQRVERGAGERGGGGVDFKGIPPPPPPL